MHVVGSLIVEVSVLPGAHISRVARDIQDLSDRIGINITAKFNGTPILAKPGMSAAEIVFTWESKGEPK